MTSLGNTSHPKPSVLHLQPLPPSRHSLFSVTRRPHPIQSSPRPPLISFTRLALNSPAFCKFTPRLSERKSCLYENKLEIPQILTERPVCCIAKLKKFRQITVKKTVKVRKMPSQNEDFSPWKSS